MNEVIIAVISTLCIVLGWIIHRKTERIKIMENQLSEKKYKAYADLVAFFYKVLSDVKKQKNTSTNLMMDKMYESKRDILMYGSDAVFLKFNEWLCSTSGEKQKNEQQIKAQMKYFLNFVLEIRKDMQSGKTKLNQTNILENLMQNKKEAEDFMNSLI